jgi:hypothetical protein
MIRKIDAAASEVGSGRNVTGPLQIGNDWPGTFFRGDESASHADTLQAIAADLEGWGVTSKAPTYVWYLRELAKTFSECQIPQHTEAAE